MPLVTQGKNLIASAVVSDGAIAVLNNANAHIIVGTNGSATAEAVGNTVSSFTAPVVKPMAATYPQRTNNVVTFRATYGTSDANQAWNEWGITNALSSGTLLNRKVESLGTKAGTQTWVFTVDITFGA